MILEIEKKKKITINWGIFHWKSLNKKQNKGLSLCGGCPKSVWRMRKKERKKRGGKKKKYRIIMVKI